jgi:peroxiredoxin Q/BCP
MATKELEEGMKAPAFSGEVAEGETISLKDLKRKKVVLYFYPKDSTPGCTKEACAFRDMNKEIEKAGAVVIGVSKDSLKSHGNFREKYDLNFPLISDPEKKIISDYGVWKEKKMYGKTVMGVERSTFLIDGKGVIRKIWRGVKVPGHAEEVLAAVRDL